MSRVDLTNRVFQRTNYIVESGPFTGLKLLPFNTWGDDDIGSKLLGVYEHVLHRAIEDIIESKPKVVINVGCADGYYALGLAMRLPKTKVYGCDIHKVAENALLSNAKKNEVSDQVEYLSNVHHKELNEKIVPNTVMVVDCEGFEVDLLDMKHVPALANCHILVECHDFIGTPISNILIQRFNSTHQIDNIKESDIASIPWLSIEESRVLLDEHRPVKMNWLYMVPK